MKTFEVAFTTKIHPGSSGLVFFFLISSLILSETDNNLNLNINLVYTFT